MTTPQRMKTSLARTPHLGTRSWSPNQTTQHIWICLTKKYTIENEKNARRQSKPFRIWWYMTYIHKAIESGFDGSQNWAQMGRGRGGGGTLNKPLGGAKFEPFYFHILNIAKFNSIYLNFGNLEKLIYMSNLSQNWKK